MLPAPSVLLENIVLTQNKGKNLTALQDSMLKGRVTVNVRHAQPVIHVMILP